MSQALQDERDIEALRWAVLQIAYEPVTDDPLGVPGTHAIPPKGHIGPGLTVHDARVYRVHESIRKKIDRFYWRLREETIRELRDVYALHKRICEKCYNEFMGYEGQRECYRCRSKGE